MSDRKRNKCKRYIGVVFVVLVCLVCCGQLYAQEIITREGVAYPVPPATANRMFYLQRTPNTNTIACDLNIINGKPDVDRPLITYWLRYGDSPKGEKKELNFIQRKFAYGLSIHKVKESNYEFWFVSYKKYHMYLVQTQDGKWHTCGKINNAMAYMSSIFIYIKGGSFWNPHVVYVELRGKNIRTGKDEVERLTDVKKEEEN